MDRYAVIGHPVEHSLSPVIHAAFAEQMGERLTYTKLPSRVAAFAETAEKFFEAGGAGLNVTVPFKEQAAAWVDELSTPARVAGVVNTIVPMDTGYRGFNTDGVGLVRDLTENLGIRLAGKRVLLLGAGGAARGIVRPILARGVIHMTVANRNQGRARVLVDELTHEFATTELASCGFSQAQGRFDLVINATSASLSGTGALIERSSVREAVCYDLVYGGDQEPTAFCRWAQGAGARVAVDGLGMLVEQAAEAFKIWRGARPQTGPVLAHLRQRQP